VDHQILNLHNFVIKEMLCNNWKIENVEKPTIQYNYLNKRLKITGNEQVIEDY